MRLVADDEVKMSAGEKFPLVVTRRIDNIHHRGIGRKNTMRGIVLLCFAKITD